MIRHFDHVTIVVRDLEGAKHFFGLLGFEEVKSVVISGEPFATYMGVKDIEADHVTLLLPNVTPRLEVQLLHYRHPAVDGDPEIGRLDRVGFNHICFAVDDVRATAKHLEANGVDVRSELKGFHDRDLYFVTGPEGITIELAQWD